MAGETISPNMNLIIPAVGVTAGPLYASDLNASLSLIDTHNHTSGNGVQITPAGINVNVAFPMNNNNITTVKSLRLQTQSSPLSASTDIGCLYESGVDLYYNDGSGNQIRLTQSGSIVGTSGSISNLVSPATASYSSGTSTFVWQSAALTAANMDAASYILRNSTASSNGLTLNPPLAMATNFSLTLPTTPAAQNIMTLDATGNMAASWNVDGSTIDVNSNNLRVKPGGLTTTQLSSAAGILGSQLAAATVTQTNMASASIGTSQLIDANVTPAKLSAAVFVGSAAVTTTVSSASVAVITVSLTTTGRPVMISLCGDSGGGLSSIVFSGGGLGCSMWVERDSAVLSQYSQNGGQMSPNGFVIIDTPGAGAHTFKLMCSGNTANVIFTKVFMNVIQL